MAWNIYKFLALGLAPLLAASAREIIFPPIAVFNPYQSTLHSGLDDVDIITNSQFSGLTTFAHLPYVNCFVDGELAQEYDIAFLGAPFDTVSIQLDISYMVICYRHLFI